MTETRWRVVPRHLLETEPAIAVHREFRTERGAVDAAAEMRRYGADPVIQIAALEWADAAPEPAPAPPPPALEEPLRKVWYQAGPRVRARRMPWGAVWTVAHRAPLGERPGYWLAGVDAAGADVGRRLARLQYESLVIAERAAADAIEAAAR